jgi:hypothetical protein
MKQPQQEQQQQQLIPTQHGNSKISVGYSYIGITLLDENFLFQPKISQFTQYFLH